jgi:hypothetical protein
MYKDGVFWLHDHFTKSSWHDFSMMEDDTLEVHWGECVRMNKSDPEKRNILVGLMMKISKLDSSPKQDNASLRQL